MPDAKKTLIFFEGDDDKAFLEGLQDVGSCRIFGKSPSETRTSIPARMA
jgi:hypothetical protein